MEKTAVDVMYLLKDENIDVLHELEGYGVELASYDWHGGRLITGNGYREILRVGQEIGYVGFTATPSEWENVYTISIVEEDEDEDEDEDDVGDLDEDGDDVDDLDEENEGEENVIVERWGSDADKSLFTKAVSDILLPLLADKKVRIYNTKARKPLTDDQNEFQISFCDSPIQGTYVREPDTPWGEDVGETTAYPWIAGTPIIIDDFEVGAFDRHNLYIYFHIDASCSTFIRILEYVRDHWDAEIDVDVYEAAYAWQCTDRVAKELKDIETSLKSRQNEATNYRKQLAEAINSIELLQKKLTSMKTIEADGMDKFRTEYHNLLTYEHIQSVSVRGDAVVVDTDALFCVDPRTDIEHLVGEFWIVIDPVEVKVRMFNKLFRIDGMRPRQNAPHVWSDGSPCLGNIGNIVPELIGRREYPALAGICIEYLQAINQHHDEAGKHVHKWPVSQKWIADNGGPEKAGILASDRWREHGLCRGPAVYDHQHMSDASFRTDELVY